ncbi:MAG: phosphotransferase [Thiotrichales bacterium]|nr:phosphotransferase [Thiotrichales bacterium]
MRDFSKVYSSLRFLLIDLQKQLQTVYDGLIGQDTSLFAKSQERMDYIENAHLSLLNHSFHSSLRQGREQLPLQGFEHISYSLLNLSLQLNSLSQELQKLKSLKLLQKKRITQALQTLNRGLSLIVPALESEDLALTLNLCQLQGQIDKLGREQLQRYSQELKNCEQQAALLQCSFIVRDIQSMGNTLLKVGEGLLSAKLGQFMQIDRYQSLEATLCDFNQQLPSQDLRIHSMGETKSGCTLSSVQTGQEAEAQVLAIFKQGRKDKLHDEKLGIERWHQAFPGIAPEVYSYQKQGDKAALLFEYLSGETFESLLLDERERLQTAINRLFSTLSEIWHTTVQARRIAANFMPQLQKRLSAVYAVHPEFNLKDKGLRIGTAQQVSLEKLIQQATMLESELQAPFAVYIHGDFNVDNILYNAEQDSVNFVDLHRSEYQDYTQDLSVLMVSFYRLAYFEPKTRQRIRLVMEAIYDFGADYAESQRDHDYAKRMTLGLARSYISSTRFVLDKEHAKSMLFKGRYLLEHLIHQSKDNSTYRLPKELLRETF